MGGHTAPVHPEILTAGEKIIWDICSQRFDIPHLSLVNTWNICNYQEHFVSSHKSLDGDKDWCRKPDLLLTHSPRPELCVQHTKGHPKTPAPRGKGSLGARLWDHSMGDQPALINRALCPCQPLGKLLWTKEKHSTQEREIWTLICLCSQAEETHT